MIYRYKVSIYVITKINSRLVQKILLFEITFITLLFCLIFKTLELHMINTIYQMICIKALNQEQIPILSFFFFVYLILITVCENNSSSTFLFYFYVFLSLEWKAIQISIYKF